MGNPSETVREIVVPPPPPLVTEQATPSGDISGGLQAPAPNGADRALTPPSLLAETPPRAPDADIQPPLVRKTNVSNPYKIAATILFPTGFVSLIAGGTMFGFNATHNESGNLFAPLGTGGLALIGVGGGLFLGGLTILVIGNVKGNNKTSSK